MKKLGVLLILMLIFTGVFVFAEELNTSVSDEDVQKVEGLIENYSPLNESGKVDFEKFKPFKTKADERIEKINKYIGPITKILWGVELSLSWIFIFSFILWILLIEFIVMPVSEILDFNILGSLAGATIIASLAMQGFGKNFVIFIESLMTQWWAGALAILTAIIVGVVYSLIMKSLGAQVKASKENAAKSKTDMDRTIIHADAKVSKKNLE